MFELDKIIRDNIRKLKPYSSARDEFSGEASVYLDANENPFESLAGEGLNRYPDPLQRSLKTRIAPMKGVKPAQIFLGNGSDEPIDLLFRAFCEPATDNVVQMVPTYGMYKVSADINNVEIRNVLLRPDFSLDPQAMLAAADARTKILFVCSPNNPTGNQFAEADIRVLLNQFGGLVVVDEAYADFAQGQSLAPLVDEFPNLVVLQTFSKAWGMAALRLGLCMAQEPIIEILNRIKPPYNINQLTQQAVLSALDGQATVGQWVATIRDERKRLRAELERLPFVQKVFPSDANFVLVRVQQPRELYTYLMQRGIIVRDRSTQPLCEGCVRITIGTPKENGVLLATLKNFSV